MNRSSRTSRMDEHRAHKRVKVNMSVAYRDDVHSYRVGSVCNISRGGMFVNTVARPDVDGYVLASIDAADFGKIIRIQGRVVRRTDSGMAIVFTGTDEKGLNNLLSYWCVPF
jgi:hypothetical protein